MPSTSPSMKPSALPSMPPSSKPSVPQCFDCSEGRNPCDPSAVGTYFYPHCDIQKFVQCSAFGQCFPMNCPGGLQWDESKNVCVFAE
mmetsp:Transcript_20883/g.30680  ORF Transcript_20883/g.30680 Transcript_20883/m.30680 type:complete len:87 (+) Transcript_20883:2-262(+)